MLTLLPADRSREAVDPPLALDALHRGVLEDARNLRTIQVRMARRLLALRRAPSLYRFGATTFSLYCESIGLSASEGRDLASLAEAALVRPDVVPRFAAGRLSLGKVSALAHLLRLGPPVGSIPDSLNLPAESQGPDSGPPASPDREDRAGEERAGEERAGGERTGGERAGGERAGGERAGGERAGEERDGEERDGEERDWVRTAEGVTTRDLWRLLEERRERQRLRESPEFVAMFVSRRGREDFLRCRNLVSRREWLPVTEGATLERVCDTFLGRHDPERRAARLAERDRKRGPIDSSVPTLPADGSRHLVDTAASRAPLDAAEPRSPRRAIPAALRRDLIRRFGDCCWVEGCDRRCFLEFAHRIPVRFGGNEEPDNFLRLCGEHHAQLDGDGWRLIPRRDGVVLLIDQRGVVVGRLRSAIGSDTTREATPMARETAAGETAARETAAGESAAGETATGVTPAGETAAGETATREAAAPEPAARETVE